MTLLIKNGKVFLKNVFVKTNILIEDSNIKEIGPINNADEIIDASGKYVVPGLIDMHVHFRDFGQEYKEDWVSASKAAASSGITTVFDMPNNKIPITTKRLLDEKAKIVSAKSLINFRLYISMNKFNVDEINENKLKFVKLYYGETTGNNKVDDAEDIFKRVSKEIAIVVHAEDNNVMDENKRKYSINDKKYHSLVRDNKAEYKAVMDLIGLAEKYGNRLHITHISCKESAELIKKAKKRGVKVTGDTCPHYLFLDDSLYDKIGNKAKVNPALKSKNDKEALWKFLNDGTIDCICSDHAPHTLEEKNRSYNECPSGFPGAETTIPLMLTAVNEDKIKFENFLEKMTTAPAKIFNLINKGELKQGFDADITIIDLEKENIIEGNKLFTKAKWSPFSGMKTKGKAVLTIVNGR
ncbi:MAG: dihydroorotase family protein, partial [Nanoarchaeota archaeon]